MNGTIGVEIFDGDNIELYVNNDYHNDFNGDGVDDGTYYYKITNNGHSQIGYITIKRH